MDFRISVFHRINMRIIAQGVEKTLGGKTEMDHHRVVVRLHKLPAIAIEIRLERVSGPSPKGNN